LKAAEKFRRFAITKDPPHKGRIPPITAVRFSGTTSEILAIASESIFKVSGRVGDGKMNTIGSASSRGNSDRVHRLIEGGSQAIDDIVGEVGVPIGEWLRESDFVKLVDAIRVGLNETHVWFLLEKFLDPSVKIANVYLCPRDPSFRAIEWISHGEEASV
jgi:hypothetical protein